MRGQIRLFGAVVAVVVSGLVALVGGSTAGAAPQPTANGNGSVSTAQSFSFGTRGALFSAEGRIQVVNANTDPNTTTKGRINCALYVANGVFLSGNITDVSPTTLPQFTPTNFIAYAEDNGEPGQFIDRWQFFSFVASPSFSPNCVAAQSLLGSGQPITAGNIDVDPVTP